MRIGQDQSGEGFDRRTSVDRLRSFIASAGFRPDDRLPPERKLAPELQLTRGALRQALTILENNGEITRHVGRGTFVKAVPAGLTASSEFDLVANMTNPFDVMEARLIVEPKVAAQAALRARPVDHWQFEKLLLEGEATADPIAAQGKGDALHRAIAAATHNPLLLALFDAIYRVRASTNWGQLRPSMMPPARLVQLWRQHRGIVEAVLARDAPLAEQRMFEHIDGVQKQLRSPLA